MNNELKKLHEYVNQFNDMNDFIFNAFKKNIYINLNHAILATI